MRKILIVASIIGVLALGAGGVAYAATSGAGGEPGYCVTFGHGEGASGNYVLWNWDHLQCPSGTYAHDINTQVISEVANNNLTIGGTGNVGNTSFTLTDVDGGITYTYTCTLSNTIKPVPNPDTTPGFTFTPAYVCSLNT